MKKLKEHIRERFGCSPAVFSRFKKADNPLPIGTRDAYRICRGKEVSRSQILLIKEYLENYEKNNNVTPPSFVYTYTATSAKG